MNFTAEQHITGHAMAIYDVIFENGKIYTTSADKFVARWSLEEEKQDGFAIKLEHSAFRITKTKHNCIAIGNSKGGIHFVDIEKKQELRLLQQHKAPVFSLAYNEKADEIYSGDGEGYFCVWDGKTMDLKLTFPYNCGKIRCIAISEDSSHLAICGQDGFIRILEAQFFNEIHTFKAHKDGVNCAIFKGDILFTGGKDAYIRKWNWKDDKKLAEVAGHNYAVYDLILLNNNELLVSASFDKTIKTFNTSDLEFLKRYDNKEKGHKHTVNRLAKVSDNSFLSVSDDRVIICWQAINE